MLSVQGLWIEKAKDIAGSKPEMAKPDAIMNLFQRLKLKQPLRSRVEDSGLRVEDLGFGRDVLA